MRDNKESPSQLEFAEASIPKPEQRTDLAYDAMGDRGRTDETNYVARDETALFERPQMNTD
jgi:hypothetical protein